MYVFNIVYGFVFVNMFYVIVVLLSLHITRFIMGV